MSFVKAGIKLQILNLPEDGRNSTFTERYECVIFLHCSKDYQTLNHN